MESTLEGHRVIFYLAGGWSLEGIVQKENKDTVVVDTDGQISMIWKNKLSALTILNQEVKNTNMQPRAVESRKTVQRTGGYDLVEKVDIDNEEFEMNHIGIGNQTGSILPSDLLINDGVTDEPVEDFSISMTKLKTPGKGYTKE